jgi:hypothetical protein
MYRNYGYLFASCLPAFGGYSGNSANAGTFYLGMSRSAAYPYADIGGRLMFL